MRRNVQVAAIALASAIFACFGVRAQTPGGVAADLRVWLRSDKGFAPSEWQDQSGNVNHYTQTNADRQPFTAEKLYNFNPVIDFGGSASADGRFMVVPSGKPYSANNTSSTIFATSINRSTPTYADIIGFGATTTTSLLTQANAPVLITNGAKARLYPYTASTLTDIQVDQLYLNDVSFTFGTSGVKYGLNGQTASVASTVTAGNAQHANGSILGSQPEVRNGLIGEVIAYERDLSEDEKIRVRSYVAIKYGLTLPHNYVASNGTTVFWDQSINTGYGNNIAGIARDDQGGLYQKQSWSTNQSAQVLISTTGLANANAANTGTLTNAQFLTWGDNGLARTPNVSIAGISGISHRFASIWKVQNTASVGTVRVAWEKNLFNLSLIQSADNTFDASDVVTGMTANETTINGVVYNYADVTLSNGQYFTFAAQVTAPGGVAPAAWYRADVPGQQFVDAGNTAATDGQTLQQWNEYTGSGYNLAQSTSGNRPVFSNSTTLANFNPTVTFNGSQWMRYTAATGVNVIDRENGSIYAAGYLNNLNNVGFAGFHASMNYPGIHTFNVGGGDYKLLFFTGGPGYNGRSSNSFANKQFFTIGSGWQNGEGSSAAYAGGTVSLNGVRKVYSGTSDFQNAIINDASRDFQIGQDSDHGALNGQLNEVVVFENRLSEDDMDRVETYLAIKFGTTFAEGGRDYKSSQLTPVWSATTNVGYHHNIAGIARDDQGALHQKQSWSTKPGQQVLISTTGLANTNQANDTSLNNGQFLVWGDNGLEKTPTNYNPGLGHGVNLSFKAVWKVQNTGNVGTVRVAWPKGLNNLSLVQSADATIDGSDIFTSMASNSQTINGVEYNYVDVTLSDGQYFTFAASIQNAPGGVFTGLSQWYRADMSITNTGDATDVTAWTDVASNVIANQITGVALPKFKTGTADYFNFNPGVNFTATNQTIGNLAVQTLSAQQYDVFTLTKEGIVPGGNGRVFSSLVNNANQTGNIAYWDGLGINAANSVERVNTTYSYRYLANPGNVDWSTNSPSIMYHTFTNTTVAKGLNGAAKGATATHPAIGDFNGGFTIGTTQFPGNGSDNAGFTGHIGELIIYGSGNITALERNKVDSYLAVKYGVTMSDTVNYITSAGDTVWNAAANTDFYNNVAGLGRDNISALHQKQSRSQHANTNSQITMGLGDIFATNALNTNSLNNGQFMLWGDNGNTQAMTNSAATYTTFTYQGATDNRRMNRVWKVQNTGVSQTVKISFPTASVGTTTLPGESSCSEYVIIYASDAAFTSNVRVASITVNGLNYEALNNFAQGVSYFTYGKINGYVAGTVVLPTQTTTAPDFSACAANGWKYAKQTASTNKYLAIYGMNDTQLGSLDVTIDPVGTEFNGSIHTKLMPRVTTVTDADSGSYTGVKVRVYFSQAEIDSTIVSGAKKSGWFKFEGDASAARADVNSDGLLNPNRTVEIVPSGSGVEDGVSYVEFDNVTTFSSFIYVSTTNETALPVRLVRFDATKKGSSALLTWETAQESGNKGFEIQRGAGNSNWQTIGFVGGQTEDGNSNTLLHYNFADETPLTGKNYYRLKQVDWDGSSAYSRIVVVDFQAEGKDMLLYPNPVAGGAVTLDLPESGTIAVRIYNLSGIQVKAFKQSSRVLDVKGLSSGKYVLKTVTEDGKVYEKTFMIP